MKRRANGEGTFYLRKDGRWEAAGWAPPIAGKRKRIHVYAKSRPAARAKLMAALDRAREQLLMPNAELLLGPYLDHWLKTVEVSRRPSTYAQYSWVVGSFLKPELGQYTCSELSLRLVQSWFNRLRAEGYSPHRLRLTRLVLSAVLTRAQREEAVIRNVAQLVELPHYEPKERIPWTVDEAKQFLDRTVDHPYHPAFVLLVTYGLRRGEVLGLRWQDIDMDHGVLRIRNTLQRFGGAFRQGPVKTKAGRRDLPLLPATRQCLLQLRPELTGACQVDGLIFADEQGKPPDPDSFSKTFQRLARRHDLPVIRVHDLRHTTATLLKDLNVPARDAQSILGHADITTTLRIYQHVTIANRRDALARVGMALYGMS